MGGAIKRFKERENHPLKQWKLSPVDLAHIGKLDPLVVGRAHKVYERGENPNAIL